MMFIRLQTQWNYTMGARTGLNLQSLEWFCRVYNCDDVPAMIEGLQVMERAALNKFAEQAK